jgi:exopolysaccharide production protein ExoQ
MVRDVALFLTVGFCIFAFNWERRSHCKSSFALWLATLWVMRCASRGLDSWISSGGSLEEGANVDQSFLLVMTTIGFVVVGRRWSRVRAVLRHNLPVVVFFVYIALSVTWSEIEFDSAKRLFRTLGDLTMVLIILTETDPLEASLTVLRRTALLLIPFSVLLAKYYGELGRMREKNWAPDSWIGVTTHKNCLGQLCFLAAIVFFIEIIRTMRRRKLSIWQVPVKLPLETIYFVMTLFLLNGGGRERSSTSVIAFAGGIGSFCLLEKLRSCPRAISRVFLTLVCVLGLLSVTASFLVNKSLSDIVAESQGKDGTLTGRTDLWTDILAVANRPIFGAGYMSFWTPSMMAYFKSIRRESWGPQQAHNGYLETYIQLGWVGVILLVLLIVHGLSRSSRSLFQDFDYGRFRLILLLVTLLQNYTEAGFPRPTNLLWFTFLLVTLDPYRSYQSVMVSKMPRTKTELPVREQQTLPL